MYEVVIDVQKGERVFLNDLIEINDEFLDLLYDGSVLYGSDTITPFSWYELPVKGHEAIRKQSREELFAALEECSTPLSEFSHYEDLYSSKFFWHSYFHVANGKLYIMFGFPMGYGYGIDTGIMLYTDDIEEFLKVPKW